MTEQSGYVRDTRALAMPERISLQVEVGKHDVAQGWDHIETMAKKAVADFTSSEYANVAAYVPGTEEVRLALRVEAIGYRLPRMPDGIEGVEFDFGPGGIRGWWRGVVARLNPDRATQGFLFHFPTKTRVLGD